nr:hypothetical protein [Tanacetum cinerariifolium]
AALPPAMAGTTPAAHRRRSGAASAAAPRNRGSARCRSPLAADTPD